MGAVREPKGKHTLALDADPDRELGEARSPDDDAEKVIVVKRSHVAATFLAVSLVTLLSLGTGLRALADSRQGASSSAQMSRIVTGHDEQISDLKDALAAREAEHARETSVLKKDIRLIQTRFGDLRKEISESTLEGNILRVQIKDLETSQEEMMNKMVELSNELHAVKSISQGMKK